MNAETHNETQVESLDENNKNQHDAQIASFEIQFDADSLAQVENAPKSRSGMPVRQLAKMKSQNDDQVANTLNL